MYHKVNLTLSATDTLKSDKGYVLFDDNTGTLSGWWILPGVILGALSWIGIFSLIF